MNFPGEHLLPGQLGHIGVVISFVSAGLSAYAYYRATSKRNDAYAAADWVSLGRKAFVAHAIATLGVIAALWIILTGKMYEYHYAWANVSDELPWQYVFSAFWKEQQGSFLLWSFWHIVLALILIMRKGRWEAPVLAVIALAEMILASMLLGVYIGEFRVGASPFDLLRNLPENLGAPIFDNPNYLQLISGNGLNPLLQNYWMTIHPPTLFLGFASTIVPFAFAVAGLWQRAHEDWLRPALPWALFSGAILGLGILMGGAWAYEALSFGGYWAWDPVENTSLVPWITLVAGLHVNLVARATGHSIRSAYGFYLATFVLILYSTYLTRSGILGDSSAHAFTEMGLELQLLLLIFVFLGLGLYLFFSRYKGVPQPVKAAPSKAADEPARVVTAEESTQSREFWMFIGALVLMFSAILITGATALPVVNKIIQAFDPSASGFALRDPIEHHNRYQTVIGIFVALLSGMTIFMRYKESSWKGRFRRLGAPIVASVAFAGLMTALTYQWFEAFAWQHSALLFAGFFAIATNLSYLVMVAQGNLSLAAAALSHLGFGILLLGILSTGLKKHWISSNRFAMEGLIEGMGPEEAGKNVLLLREAPMPIREGYVATYLSDTIERQTRTFNVEFSRQDASGQPTGERFRVYPNVMYSRQFDKIVASNPSTRHYWNYDIFTHVSSLPRAEMDPEFARQIEDSLKFEVYQALVGDTIFTKNHYLVVEGLTKSPQNRDYQSRPGDLAFALQLRAYSLEDRTGYPAEPVVYLRPGEGGYSLPVTVGQLQMKIRLSEAAMEKMLALEDALVYQPLRLKEGGSAEALGLLFRFERAEKDIKHPAYIPQPGDIGIAAVLSVSADNGKTADTLRPVYLVRDSRSFSLKDDNPLTGIHVRFEGIDPATGVLSFGVAQATPEQRVIPIEIAENAARSDYIVLEAIVFPGINMVWLGSLLMLLGLALGWLRKRRAARQTQQV